MVWGCHQRTPWSFQLGEIKGEVLSMFPCEFLAVVSFQTCEVHALDGDCELSSAFQNLLANGCSQAGSQ